MSISIEEQKRIIKQYLGIFYTKLTKEDIVKYKKLYPKITNHYIYAFGDELKKIGAYLLLCTDNNNAKIVNGYSLFDNYIGRNEEDKSWLDMKTRDLFIYFPSHTETNKKTNEIFCHLVSHRAFSNLNTIFLTETHIIEVSDLYDKLNGKKVHFIKQLNLTETKSEVSKNIVKMTKSITKETTKKTDMFM